MKKLILLICIVCMVTPCLSCDNNKSIMPKATVMAEDFKIGMSYNEVSALLKNEPHEQFLGYIYFVDPNGKYVLLDLHSPTYLELNKISTYDAITPQKRDFEKIQAGMTFYEVVSIVGFSTEPMALSGMLASEYTLQSGKTLLIYRNSGGDLPVPTVTELKWMDS